MIKINDIVQITDSAHQWFPCLIIVSELKSFGIQGYINIPVKEGAAYIRLDKKAYEKVGTATVVFEEGEG